MRVGSRLLCVAAFPALLVAICGFAHNPSRKTGPDVIVTAAPAYEPLAALHGGERFPKGAKLLLVHEGEATPLIEGFAASADASVSFDGQKVLFAGKKAASDPWEIWEFTLRDQSLRQVTTGSADAIRPLYLPGWRFVYAHRTPQGFQLQSARLMESKALTEIEPSGTPSILPLTYINASTVPADVLADGRILFEAGFPLGSAARPEIFLVYSDGSGVESYRCDHGTDSTDGRWGGKQLSSGDVVFTHGNSLARFTSPLAHEERVAAPRAEYAGGIVETPSGAWLLSVRETANAKYALRFWKPGASGTELVLAQNDENLLEPVILAEHHRPRRHPSGLHEWDYANLLALDARVSRDGELKGKPVSVRLEAQNSTGDAIVMGTAPVEEDGSFFVKAPADRAIRLALIDTKGAVLRQEQGWFWIRRGEQRICVGCHAGPERGSENRVPAVLLRTTTPVDLSGMARHSLSGGN
jgi:hypothetical protein